MASLSQDVRPGAPRGLPAWTNLFFFSKQQKGPRSDNSKSNKIFVGGIPHNCGETELREYFKKFGVVSSPWGAAEPRVHWAAWPRSSVLSARTPQTRMDQSPTHPPCGQLPSRTVVTELTRPVLGRPSGCL